MGKNRVVAWACALAGLVGSGCGPTNTFHGDLAFTADERLAIEDAARTMSARTGGVPVEITWDGAIDDGEQRIVRQRPPRAPTKLGQYYFNSSSYSRSIYVTPGVDMRLFRIVVEHEFGHWYHLDHLPDGQVGLMMGNDVAEWSVYDVMECQRVGLCRH